MRLDSFEKLESIVAKKKLRIHFQPIVELGEGHLFGYESLSRGPSHTGYESPEVLFREARRVNLLFELESECQRKLLLNLAQLSDIGFFVFFNLEPVLLETDNCRKLPIFESLANVDPRNFVIELTERHNIHKEECLRKNLQQLREMGFKIALDDIGSGYSDLDSIIEFRPDFLKISNRIIQNISTNAMKQKVVAMLLELSESFAFTVAEGIETIEDLRTLRTLGVRFGQGYLLARPTSELEYVHQPHLYNGNGRQPSTGPDWTSTTMPQII